MNPGGVLSGDAFFVDSVGRPDLMGDDQTDELTEKLFHTVQDFYMKLDDGVIIYPCHGAGSACGPDIGDRMSSTVSYERQHNTYAQITDFKKFCARMKEDAVPVPTHYPRLKKVNAAGPPVLGNLPRIPPMPPERFAEMAKGGQLVDTRDMLAFGGGHISGALNIGARPELSVWAGWLLNPETPIFLITETDRDLAKVLKLLWRTGYTDFGGYLAGGMGAWREAGHQMHKIPQMTVHEVKEANGAMQLLDVRKDEEWEGEHIPGAKHVFLGELRDCMGDLERSETYATYCASGFRASIASSILAANGFGHVRNIPGSWKVWTSAGYETQTPS